MNKVTFRGTGQLNGPVIINKTLELDDKTAITLTGLKRNDVILAILAMHYPGVRIDAKKIGIESIYFNEKNIAKQNQKTSRKNSKKSKSHFNFTFSNIILWILFFPFKLAWWVLKNVVTKDSSKEETWDKYRW